MIYILKYACENHDILLTTKQYNYVILLYETVKITIRQRNQIDYLFHYLEDYV